MGSAGSNTPMPSGGSFQSPGAMYPPNLPGQPQSGIQYQGGQGPQQAGGPQQTQTWMPPNMPGPGQQPTGMGGSVPLGGLGTSGGPSAGPTSFPPNLGPPPGGGPTSFPPQQGGQTGGAPPGSNPNGANPAQMTGGGVAGGLNQAWQANQNIVGGNNLNPSSNQYLQDYYNAAAQPLTQQFQQVTDPSILGNAVKSGNLFSSAPQQVENEAQTSLAQGLGNLGAGIYEPAYEQGLAQQSNAINAAPGLAAAQYLPAQELAGIGSQQQQLQQSIMNYPLQMLGSLAGLVGPGTGGSGVQIGTSQQPGSMK